MRLPRMIVLGNVPVVVTNVSTRNGQPLRRLKYPGGMQSGCSPAVGCLVWSSGLLFLPLTYVIAGLLAPPGHREARSQIRDMLEMTEFSWFSFLADVSLAQIIAVGTVYLVLLVGGIVWGLVGARRRWKRLPCAQCGATPLELASRTPFLLICALCLVAWEVEVPRPGSDDGHHHHHHHF